MICPKCDINFKFSSILKRHLNLSSRCKSSEQEIIVIINNINNFNLNNNNINRIVTNIIISCTDCKNIFTKKSSLKFHKINSKCGKTQIAKAIESKYGIHKLSIEQLKLLYPDNFKIMLNNIQSQPPSQPPSQNQTPNQTLLTNQINSHNTNTNTINSNNIINNTTIIQHINPFGFEDVRTIPIDEMKTILSSGENAGIQIIKSIYNKIENKNFYKPNMSRPEIACLNRDFILTIYKCKEFCDALFDRCITFLHHMLYLCKNEYSKSSIKHIYDNIEFIETTMRTEIYDKQLQTIIESEFRNNNLDNKDRIKKFIKEIKENIEAKEQSTSLVNNITSLTSESNDDYKISIYNEELNKVLGDPKIILGLQKKELIDEFYFKRLDETKFYKFWKDRIKNEKTYIYNCTTTTIGDINNQKLRTDQINNMLNIIKKRSDTMTGPINLDVKGFLFEDISLDDE